MPVIDASVYVSAAKADDKNRNRARAWLNKAQAAGEQIISPAILIAEVASGMRVGLSSAATAREVVRELEEGQSVRFVPVSPELASKAAQIAIDCGLKGADAIYVAVAAELEDCLVTFDRNQRERATHVVRTLEP